MFEMGRERGKCGMEDVACAMHTHTHIHTHARRTLMRTRTL